MVRVMTYIEWHGNMDTEESVVCFGFLGMDVDGFLMKRDEELLVPHRGE